MTIERIEKSFRGFLLDVPNQVYHANRDFYSSSDLKYIYANSPFHFKATHIDEPRPHEPTKEMLMGSLVHSLVLEPGKFDSDFAVMPELNLRTNAGKEARDVFMRENSLKVVVPSQMLEQARLMADSVKRTCPQTLEKLTSREISFFWDCPFSKLPFKAKIDGMGFGQVIELKTASSAKPEVFSRQAFNLNYDLSAVHYLEGIRNVSGDSLKFSFLVVENEYPFVCQEYSVTESFLASGHAKWLGAVAQLATGLQENKWPAYGEDLQIDAPAWARKTEEV